MKYVMDVGGELKSRGHFVSLACPARSIQAGRAAELGIPSIEFEMHDVHDWKQLPGFTRAVAGKYDVVHIHSPLDYVVPAIGARLGRIPAVVMTRHLPHPFASKRNAYICTSLLYHRIIAVSNFVRTVMIKSGAQASRVDVVHNGIVPLKPDPGSGRRLRDEFSIPQDAILVGAAGRVSVQKGFDVLMRAVQKLIVSGVPVYCVIFGAGPMLEEIRKLSVELQIARWVRLPGFRQGVHDLWRAADIAVVPSVWEEPFGYVALEALSAGCPVIATRSGALPEVLSADAGLLTEPGNVDELAATLHSLALSPVTRARMRQAATRRAAAFTLDANVMSVERLYAELLARRGSWKSNAQR